MTELELYQFINDNEIEYRWEADDVYVWIYLGHSLKEFAALSCHFLEDGGYNVNLQETYVCIEMKEVCGYFGIELKNVFGEKPES